MQLRLRALSLWGADLQVIMAAMLSTPQERRERATEELRRWFARHNELLPGGEVLGLLIGCVIRIYRQNGSDKSRFDREMGQAWDVSPEQKTILD